MGYGSVMTLLDIIAVYYNILDQRNLMIQSRENVRKPQIRAILGPFCPIFENRANLMQKRDRQTDLLTVLTIDYYQ